MRILIVNPPVRENDNPHFPTGLGYLAAVLKKEGHEVSVIDAAALKLRKTELIDRIKKEQFDVFAVGGLITIFNYLKWLTGEVRNINPKALIISGGSAVSSIPQLFLKRTGVDVGLLYEAEATIIDLIKLIEEKKDYSTLPGIAYRNKEGNITANPLRTRIDNLDDLPFPAYDLFPMNIYLSFPQQMGLLNMSKSRKAIGIIATRGCPWKCTFCHRNFGNVYRTRSPENVVAEMEMLYKTYGISFFDFKDETLTVNRAVTEKMCDLLIERGHDFKWQAMTRADLVNKELLLKMKKAGCIYINFGLESGSQRMLDAVDKKIKVETMEQAIKWVKEVNIELTKSFMIGIPGESKETAQETIDFCKRLDLNGTFFICTPYPGTILWEKLKSDGKIVTEEDEAQYIEHLATAGDAINLNMNVSGMPDEELLEIRSWATKEIAKNYYKNHPIEYLQSRIEWFKYATKTLTNIYKTHGPSMMASTIYNKLSGKRTRIFTTAPQ